jgi:hypothetical protein
MAPINLNTTSRVNPTIRKGSSINHMSGKRKIITSANGQHKTNKMHQRRKAIRVLIFLKLVRMECKQLTRILTG